MGLGSFATKQNQLEWQATRRERSLALPRHQSPTASDARPRCATRARSLAMDRRSVPQSPPARTASASNCFEHRPARQNVQPVPECLPGVRVEAVGITEIRIRGEKGPDEICPRALDFPG